MIASSIRAEVVAEKISYVRNMLEALRLLPLSTYEDFLSDARNAAAAESYLRRALEALFDLGRHILARAFSMAPAEYKQIAEALVKKGVVSKEEGRILREMAGYRNRMVHFYQEIGEPELYSICRDSLGDIEMVTKTFGKWLEEHPQKVTRL